MLRNRRSHEVCTPRLESGCCSPQLEKAEATVKTQHSQKQISKKNFFTCYSDRAGLPLAFSAWRWRMLNHIGMRGTHRQDWPVPSADDTERQLHFQVVEAFFQTKILHRIPICKMYLRRAIFFFPWKAGGPWNIFMGKQFNNHYSRDFTGSSVVKNPCFHCRGYGIHPWPGG